MDQQEEKRKHPRVHPEGLTALVLSPCWDGPYCFQVEDMSASGLGLGIGRRLDKSLKPDDVVDVELWGLRRAIRARALVVRRTQAASRADGIALKFYSFDDGDEDYYRSVLDLASR